MDKLDQRILELIKDNARLSYSEIGKSVGISRVAVKKRMARGSAILRSANPWGFRASLSRSAWMRWKTRA